MRNEKNEYLDNLSFQKIFAFFAVAECGSFTKAAEKLNMSQAAVSRIIANIEWDTKLILFVRNVRGAHLTPAGRILYQKWKEAVRDFDTGYRDAYKVQMGYIKNLSVGSINMEQNLDRHIPFWNWLEKTFSKEVITVDFDKTEVLRDGLISHKYDIIFINSFEMDYLRMLGIHCRVLAEKSCSLYIHKNHPLYTKETISDTDLRNQDITFFGTESSFSSKEIKKFCRKYDIDSSNIYFDSDYRKAMLSFIRKTGLFLSEDIFPKEPGENIRRIPLDDIKSGLVIAWINEDLNFAVAEIAQYVQRTPQYFQRTRKN